MKKLIITVCMAIGFGATMNVVAQTQELSFGFISTEASNNLKTAWQPLLDDMSKATGLKIKAFFAPDYAGVIEGMRFNKVQVGWFGNKSAMEAVDRSNGQVFAKVIMRDGSEGYYSLVLVHKDSPIKNVDDLIKQHANLTLGYGDPNSTSGTLIPGYYLFSKHGIDPMKNFKRTVRANHETNLLAVINKQVDVATNNTELLYRYGLNHAEQLKEVREIWRSPLIASEPIVWRKDLDSATQKKISDFLFNYGKTPQEKEILTKLGYSGFRVSTDDQLLPIRQIELAKERAKIEASGLAAEERVIKLKEIDAKLVELNQKMVSAK